MSGENVAAGMICIREGHAKNQIDNTRENFIKEMHQKN